jgi:anaerobic selenocysteine-containing dehydrogenase
MAKARGIADGETVRVYNEREEIHLKARVGGAFSQERLPRR